VGALRPSAGAAREADTLGYWFHILPPLDCWSVYTVLTDGFIQAKGDYRASLAAHDHTRANRLLREVIDLCALCAEAAEGLALMRARFMASDRPWPLTRLRSH
jgi:hypothetical protein